MPIRIPKSHKEPLQKLALLPLQRRKKLVCALRDAPKLMHLPDLAAEVSEKADLDRAEVHAWIGMLASMYLASQTPDENFVGSVAEAVKQLLREEELKKGRVNWVQFAADLTSMLSCHESLGVTAKALRVRSEYDSVFDDARIVTDIRPVFGPNPDDSPLAAAVVHILRISYRKNESRNDFYVALDARDLRDLKAHVDRAMEKELSLKNQLAKTDMHYLEVEVD